MASAAELLRESRRRAGLTLRQVSRVSGVAESRISDYEHGRHEPSVAMLQRLLDATGHRLVAVARPRPDLQRNARVFADLLSLVDAIPFAAMQEARGRVRPDPPTWAELVRTGSAGR